MALNDILRDYIEILELIIKLKSFIILEENIINHVSFVIFVELKKFFDIIIGIDFIRSI